MCKAIFSDIDDRPETFLWDAIKPHLNILSLNALIPYYYTYLYVTSPFKLCTTVEIAFSVTIYLIILPTRVLIYWLHSHLYSFCFS